MTFNRKPQRRVTMPGKWLCVCLHVCVYNFILLTTNRVLSLGKLVCALCGVPEAIPRFWTLLRDLPGDERDRLNGGLFKIEHNHQITF